MKPANANLQDLTCTLSVYENTGLNINIKFKDTSIKTFNPNITEEQTLMKNAKLSDYVTINNSPFKMEVKDKAGNVIYTLNSEIIFE